MDIDITQLHRVRQLAKNAGLFLKDVDVNEFAATYEPLQSHDHILPASFAWLCHLCDPIELSRIWIFATGLGDPSPLQQHNDLTRREMIGWPAHLVIFGNTGDESYCFAYNNADEGEPAIVTVDNYSPWVDPDNKSLIHWSWCADNFEQWLATQSQWLPKSDLERDAWNAKVEARSRKERR